MGLFDFLNHVQNFVAPAAWVVVLVTVVGRVFMKSRPVVTGFFAQAAINFVVSLGALVFGLWFFGHDGKMLSYTAMVLVCATSQWLMQRGWQT